MLNRIGNVFVQWILRSPLHRLLDHSLALITVTGRKTGRHYTTPVSYLLLDSEHVIIFSQPQRQWWLNLRGGAPVDLVLNGRQRHGYGHAVEERPMILDALREYLRLTPEKAETLVGQRVLLRITMRP